MVNIRRGSSLLLKWRQLDTQLLIAIFSLCAIGMVLVVSASPAIAYKLGLKDSYFAMRQLCYFIFAALLMFFFAFQEEVWLRRIALLGLLVCISMLIAVKFYGYEIKGSYRWMRIMGFSMQPSEFIKPFFAVISGFLLANEQEKLHVSLGVCLGLYAIIAALLLTQPDFGMWLVLTAIFSVQLFIAGLPFIFLAAAILCFSVVITGAYILIPHVQHRINSFLDPSILANYQVSKSLQAFAGGGLYGRGPSEGVVKKSLPDAHTDFIFAVSGEELGAILSVVLLFIFAFVVLRFLLLLKNSRDNFVILASSGIVASFGLQTIINVGVTLNLLPTKGMTLPLISYGGSSLFATAIALGILLSLTRRRIDYNEYINISRIRV